MKIILKPIFILIINLILIFVLLFVCLITEIFSLIYNFKLYDYSNNDFIDFNYKTVYEVVKSNNIFKSVYIKF